MSAHDTTPFVAQAARDRVAPDDLARQLPQRFPGIGLGESARAIREFRSLTADVAVRSSSVAAVGAAGALVFAPAVAVDPVEDAAYEAWLLRLAVPAATPVDIAEQVTIDYPTLGSVGTARVLRHGAPYPVFPDLAPADLAATLVSPRLGTASPGQVALALHSVVPALAALEVARLLVAPAVFPKLDAAGLTAALGTAGFAGAEIAAAVDTLFPPPPPPRAAPRVVAFTGANSAKVHSIDAYNFGPGQDFTLEAWIRAPVQTNLHSWDNNIIEKWSDDGDAPGRTGFPFALRIGNQNGGAAGHLFAARYDLVNNPSIQSAGTFLDDRWHHVAFVNAGRAMTLYVDGAVQGTATDTTTGPTANDWPLLFGVRGGTFWPDNFTGRLMEVRLWSRARSQAELAGTMRRALGGSEPGLVGYFPLRDGSGYDGRDGTAAHNDATIDQPGWVVADAYPLIEQSTLAPIGGPGAGWDDTAVALAAGAPITRVRVRAGNALDGIQAFYGPAGTPAPPHGGGGGNPVDVALDPGDLLTGISGIWGTWYGRGPAVLRVTLQTAAGRSYGPFGDLGGAGQQQPFSLAAPPGGQIIALAGRDGSGLVSALGATLLTVWP